MEGAKKYMKGQDMVPFISFKQSVPLAVKLIDSKEDEIKNTQGSEGGMVKGVKFLVEHNGDKKSFFTSSISLIQKLAEHAEGSVVTIMQIKYNSGEGFRTGYEVEAGDHVAAMEAKKGGAPVGGQSAPATASEENASLEDAANSDPQW